MQCVGGVSRICSGFGATDEHSVELKLVGVGQRVRHPRRAASERKANKQQNQHNRVTLPLKIPPLGHSGCHDELQEHDPNQQETLSDESTACVHTAPSAVCVVAPLFLARGICSNETCSNDPISIPEGEISFRCSYTWASPAIRVRRPTHPNTLTSRLDQVDFSDMLRPLWRL